MCNNKKIQSECHQSPVKEEILEARAGTTVSDYITYYCLLCGKACDVVEIPKVIEDNVLTSELENAQNHVDLCQKMDIEMSNIMDRWNELYNQARYQLQLVQDKKKKIEIAESIKQIQPTNDTNNN